MKERPILFSGAMVRAILEGRKTQTRRVADIEKLKVQTSKLVHGDWPIGHHLHIEPGIHKAEINQHGAVAVRVGADLLGLKPGEFEWLSRYGMRGDRLWVKETFLPVVDDDENPGWHEWSRDLALADEDDVPDAILYRATDDHHPQRWRPSIFMPRWASRLLLENVEIRLQRLQEISEEDARAEGVEPCAMTAEDIADVQISDCSPAERELARLLGPGSFSHKFTYEILWDELNAERGFGWSTNPWVWAITFKRVTP